MNASKAFGEGDPEPQGAWGDPRILSTEKVETYGASGGVGR